MAGLKDDRPRRSERSVAGTTLIVVPSLLSGAGVVLIIIAIFLDNEVAQKILLTIGLLALWLDFFTTMAIFRYSMRSINRRLRDIESRMNGDQ